MKLGHAEYVQDALKALIAAQKDLERKSKAEAGADWRDTSPKKRAALRNAAATSAEDVDRWAHELHVRLVEVGLAPPEPERYGPRTRRWAGNDIALAPARAPDPARLEAWCQQRESA